MNDTAYKPPQALELEAAVLGSGLIEASALRTLFALLPSEDVFYDPKHKLLYKSMQAMHRADKAVDMLTVIQQLRSDGTLDRVGGHQFVAGLTTKINSVAHLETHCRILQQQYARRVIIEAGRHMQQHGYDETKDPLELLAEGQQRINVLHQSLESRAVQSVASIFDEVFAQMEQAVQQQGLTGVPTGLTELNNATGGWQPSDLIILAARPGMGKTAALLHFARTAAVDEGIVSAIFSMEMPTIQLVQRMVSAEVEGYSNSDLRRGQLRGGVDEVRHLAQRAHRLKTDKILIDDTPGLSIYQLRAKCARLKAEHNIGMILVDYLQLMHGDGKGNREQEIGSISRGLKEMAKELSVPVIALSQLSRAVETRGGEKRPQLSDLRESGSLEQDADVIVFLWRGEYYNITEYADQTPTAGTMLIDLAKHRNGATGEVVVGCNMRRGVLSDLYTEAVVVNEQATLRPLPASTFDDTPIENPPF
ncbi:replicative DNA helicase [Hymenobacter aerilatus]|uniref:Replicative DNA helicase n=1 Tax=Hymenobacter aerilatus TaxID=2932251 RepID=A0A8T9T5S6_9BACT|nr:replicative DNA helicase [Hymenobacter aerilatus]UOR07199.1 replicative DNA helicase [Hymenobacter aerilatus]